jgi:hypothetical protein
MRLLVKIIPLGAGTAEPAEAPQLLACPLDVEADTVFVVSCWRVRRPSRDGFAFFALATREEPFGAAGTFADARATRRTGHAEWGRQSPSPGSASRCKQEPARSAVRLLTVVGEWSCTVCRNRMVRG